MSIGPFDTVETITFLVSLVAFILIIKAYSQGSTPASKKFWTYFLIVALFILLNRTFTNVEVLVEGDILNLLEHIATLVAAATFFFITMSTAKGDVNA